MVTADHDCRRQQQILRHHTEEFTGERHVHDAIVGAVAGDEAHWIEARIDSEFVQCVEALGRRFATEGR